jgi:tetratricopeptide (TPR) repeat protein
MDSVAIEDLLLAILATETEPGNGATLSTVLEDIAGSSQRLSRQVEIALAIERLIEQGLLDREPTGETELLTLTDEGRATASETVERLSDREIELIDGETSQTLTVEEAAERVGHSVVDIVSSCFADGIYDAGERIERDRVVGRADELARLGSVLDRVDRTGTGETVRLVGSGGTGKTALLDAFVAEAPETVDVYRMRSGGAESEPYQPIRELLATLGTDLLSAPSVRAGDTDGYEAQQTGLFTEITDQLTPASGTRVLVFDDINHADAGSWQYLGFLCRRLADRPLVVVLSHRPGTLPETAPIHPTEAFEETTLELTGLDREGTRQLVEQVLGRRGVPDAFVDAVYERTGGAPLFVESTVEALLETNQLDPQLQRYPTDAEAFDLPDAVQETIQRQLATLEDAVREVLEWIAIARGPVPVSLLQAVTDQPAERTATILETVGGMVRRSTLGGDPHVAFHNEIVGEALADCLSESERAERHRTIARQLEDLTADDESTEGQKRVDRAATIAYQYDHSGDEESAIEWHRTAAARAMDLYAHETAIDHYYRVIDLARQTGETDALLQANEQLAEIYTIVGEYDQASRHVQFVRERLSEAESPRHRRVAELAARLHNSRGEYDEAIDVATAASGGAESVEQCRLLGTLATAHEGTGDYDSLEGTAQKQRELATSLDRPEFVADALRLLGEAATHRGNYEQAEDYYEQSLEHARESGDRFGEAESLRSLGNTCFRLGTFEQAREYFERSLAIKREIGDRRGAARTLNNIGLVYFRQGTLDRADEYYEQSLDAIRGIGDRRGEAGCLLNLANIAMKWGEYDRAAANLERSHEIYQQLGDRRGEANSLQNLGTVAIRRGEYDRAVEYFEGCLAVSREIGHRKSEAQSLNNLGTVARLRGEYDRAEAYLEESLDIKRELGHRKDEVSGLIGFGILARLRGDDDRSREYFEQGRELAEQLGLPNQEAQARRRRSLLLRQHEQYDRASEQLDRALELVESTGNSAESARITLERARLALARGDEKRAREDAERACESFEEYGDPLWIGRSRDGLGQIDRADGALASAREQFAAAVEAFDEIGAPAETLRTLERLVETCLGQYDEERARGYYQRAKTVRANAPEEVEAAHAEWLDRYTVSDDGLLRES